MANALSRFLTNRNISPERLQRKNLLHTRHGKPVTLVYLRVILSKEDTGISMENLERLDKEFSLSEEEKRELLKMVKDKRKMKSLTPSELKDRDQQRKINGLLREHEHRVSQCTKAKELIQMLEKKSQEFSMLLCVDWKQHASINGRSTSQSMMDAIDAIVKNRVEAAQTQQELLHILWSIQQRVKEGLNTEAEIFGKIPSSFLMFNTEDFSERTRFVAQNGTQQVGVLMTKDFNALNQDFVAWASVESKKNDGFINTADYRPNGDLLNSESWIKTISFVDLVCTKTASLPFMTSVRIPMIQFFGIREVLAIVEGAAQKKISELKSPKVLLV